MKTLFELSYEYQNDDSDEVKIGTFYYVTDDLKKIGNIDLSKERPFTRNHKIKTIMVIASTANHEDNRLIIEKSL